MKKIASIAALFTVLITVLFMTGCERINLAEKNGPLTTMNYDNTGFTGVEVGSALKLEITQAETYSVTITAGKNIFSHIHVTQTGGILKISITRWTFGWWWGNNTPRVIITMPVLNDLHLSGASDGTVSGFKSGEDFSAEITGASHLNIDMDAGNFKAELSGASNINGRLTATGSNIELSGASNINLTGSGGDIKLNASGASTAALPYYPVKNASIDFSGASDGSIDVSGSLDVKLSGASNLKYTGNPTLGNIDISGASDLEHKQ
jgi:hypothetical protein